MGTFTGLEFGRSLKLKRVDILDQFGSDQHRTCSVGHPSGGLFRLILIVPGKNLCLCPLSMIMNKYAPIMIYVCVTT